MLGQRSQALREKGSDGSCVQTPAFGEHPGTQHGPARRRPGQGGLEARAEGVVGRQNDPLAGGSGGLKRREK